MLDGVDPALRAVGVLVGPARGDRHRRGDRIEPRGDDRPAPRQRGPRRPRPDRRRPGRRLPRASSSCGWSEACWRPVPSRRWPPRRSARSSSGRSATCSRRRPRTSTSSRAWLDATGLPEVFIGLEPFPAAPVDRPTNAQADRIAEAAASSTLVVRATACGRVSTGTGFVVSRGGYIVTNAHVVAGSKAVLVAVDGGSPQDADVVLFDPKLDIAVLHAPGIKAPALAFATSDPARGHRRRGPRHPGGAPLRIIPGRRLRHLLGGGSRPLRDGPGDAADRRAARRHRARATAAARSSCPTGPSAAWSTPRR